MQAVFFMMKMILTGLVLAFLANSVNASDFFLITGSVPRSATGGKIFRMDPSTFDSSSIGFSTQLYLPVAVDFDTVDQMIYWTEVGSEKRIQRSSLNGNGVVTVLHGGNDSVFDGLAVDPKSRQIFYTDTGRDRIGTVTIDTLTHRTIINSSLDEPRAIVLNTGSSVMFWTDWGEAPKIERANYDGSDRRTLVNTGLIAPNALALDVPNNRLYWVDSGTDKVETCDLEGHGRTDLLHAASRYTFFGLTLYQNSLYITDWGKDGTYTYSSQLVRMKLDGKREARVVATLNPGRLNDIHAYSGSQSCRLTKAGWTGTTAVVAVFIAILIN
ncbi:low-density lipoprotein receptor-related protein 5-like protein [Babylonia areolata]|uniref:low-density lipoprotein receptor-related protein 5-like protein n=1 Tax=Babylonia areolata TaxID=304850 RepID=UPI003FD6B614